jgi:hypothetical protein
LRDYRAGLIELFLRLEADARPLVSKPETETEAIVLPVGLSAPLRVTFLVAASPLCV